MNWKINIFNVFTVTFDQFNSGLQKKKKKKQTKKMVMYTVNNVFSQLRGKVIAYS